ncbi:hypothetical protein JYQ62_25140 [Nostoc sp. UHCC 0702]|nr:hypothetical protein JYQ62_25140 [Nostoc sp. UHCC 0702]
MSHSLCYGAGGQGSRGAGEQGGRGAGGQGSRGGLVISPLKWTLAISQEIYFLARDWAVAISDFKGLPNQKIPHCTCSLLTVISHQPSVISHRKLLSLPNVARNTFLGFNYNI